MENDKEVQKEAVDAARDAILREFESKRAGIKTDKVEAAEGILKSKLLKPVNAIDKEWTDRREILRNSGKDLRELRNELKPKLEEFAKIGKAILVKLTHESGNLSPEVLAKIIFDVNTDTDLYMEALQEKGHDDLNDAIKWSIGVVAGDMPTARTKAIPVLKKYVKKQFPNGKLMPVIWMVLNFSKFEDRREVAKDYIQSLNGDKAKIEEFIKEGNVKGAFSYEDMVKLRGGKKFTDPKEEEGEQTSCDLIYKQQHDFSVRAKSMATVSYGVRNVWDDVNGVSIFKFIAKAAACLTIGGNIFVNGYNVVKGGASVGSLTGLATNKNIVGSAALLAVLHGYDQNQTLEEMTRSKERRDNLSEEQALRKLKVFRGKNSNIWSKLNGFFRTNDFEGGREFFEYVKAREGVDGNKVFEKMSSTEFKDYLFYRKENAKKGKKPLEEQKYTRLSTAFAEVNDSELQDIAKVFDRFNLGGKATGIKEYEAIIDRSEKLT